MYPSEHWMVTVLNGGNLSTKKKYHKNNNKNQSGDQSHRLDSTVSSVGVPQIIY